MSKYHTQALVGADVFTVMGSIYAEVARYDSAVQADQPELASQAVTRAEEIMSFAQDLRQLNPAQKMELKELGIVFLERVSQHRKSELDSYLLPFAVAARLRQFK